MFGRKIPKDERKLREYVKGLTLDQRYDEFEAILDEIAAAGDPEDLSDAELRQICRLGEIYLVSYTDITNIVSRRLGLDWEKIGAIALP